MELSDMLGKTRTDAFGSTVPGFTVLQHSTLVGVAAVALLRCYPEFCATEKDVWDMAYFFSLHDVGKVSPGFQAQISCALTQNHGKSSFPGTEGVTFQDLLADSSPLCRYHEEGAEYHYSRTGGGSLRLDKDLRMLLRLHHGGIRNKGIPLTASTMGGGAWVTLRDELTDTLRSIFRNAEIPSTNKIKANLDELTALLCLSDWIASDESVFEVDPSSPEYTFDMDVLLDKARRAILDRNLNREIRGLPLNQTFGDMFNGWDPKPVQQLLIDAVDGPGVYILEAPMGLGKTEAALYAAYKSMHSGSATGFYFGLPTQVTSNKIHERVTFLPDAELLHGGSKVYLQQKGRLVSHHSWYSNNKRCILSAAGVGTIDQALMSCLPKVKHFFLRVLGLYRKVLILDEVHSYDAYTSELLRELVKRGHIVILLSATLTAEAKRRLLGLPDTSLVSSTSYPQVTVLKKGSLSVHSPLVSLRDVLYDVHLKSKDWMFQDALEKARKGYKVLWFENIVDEAQDIYARVPGDIHKGLLHSRYTKEHRESKESYWIGLYGKGNTSTAGSFLVTTQVAEQSLDIDADVMYTALCPMDMLLQRMGRVWRHDRPRPKGSTSPEVFIHVGRLSEESKNIHEFSKAYGGKTPYVYEPYTLLKTNKVLSTTGTIAIPSQIRQVLEDTYRDDGTFPLWRSVMYNKDRKNVSTAGQALSRGGLGDISDDEEERTLGTRLIQGDVVEVILVDEVLKKNQVIIEGKIYDLGDYKVAGILDKRKIKVARDKLPACLHEMKPTRFEVLVMVCKKGILINKDGTASDTFYTEENGLVYSKGGNK